jgi:hypothetical protein
VGDRTPKATEGVVARSLAFVAATARDGEALVSATLFDRRFLVKDEFWLDNPIDVFRSIWKLNEHMTEPVVHVNLLEECECLSLFALPKAKYTITAISATSGFHGRFAAELLNPTPAFQRSAPNVVDRILQFCTFLAFLFVRQLDNIQST